MVDLDQAREMFPAGQLHADAGSVSGHNHRQDDPETVFLKSERDLRLHAAMEKLSPQARHVLHLIYFADMSYDEAARVLRKSRRQTYHLADRSRMQLKKILEKEAYL